MGFIKNVKSLWNPYDRAESVIEVQIKCFNISRAKTPHLDRNAWLALTLRNRKGWDKEQQDWYFKETAVFSVLDLNMAPVALGLRIIEIEDPDLAMKYQNFFDKVMAPARQLTNQNKFISKWRELNPWTEANFPEVLKLLKTVIEDHILD